MDLSKYNNEFAFESEKSTSFEQNLEKITLLQKLICIQAELKCPKNQFNKFGEFYYRSCEDILEGIKPLLAKYECALTISDEIKEIGGRIYVEATVSLFDGTDIQCTRALAREEESRPKMSVSQCTGSASSYARKYALNGLFVLDDVKDADHMDNSVKTRNNASEEYVCEKCEKPFEDFTHNEKKYTAKDGYEISKRKNGIALCFSCAKELKKSE